MRNSVVIALLFAGTVFTQQSIPHRHGEWDERDYPDPAFVGDESNTPGEFLHRTLLDGNTTLIGRWPRGPCLAIDITGNIAYFGNGGYIEIVDISSPADPVELGKILTLPVVEGIVVNGIYAYVAVRDEGLRIINVSSLSNPVEVGFIDTDGYTLGVAVSGSYAYVADGVGLCIIDVSTPSSPVEVGFYNTGGWTFSVAVSGNYAYVADDTDGLRIINVSSPSNPVEVGFFDTVGLARGVAVSGSYAYVADWDTGLRIIDVSTPSNPVEVGFFNTGGWARGVAVSGSYAYVAIGMRGCESSMSPPPLIPLKRVFLIRVILLMVLT